MENSQIGSSCGGARELKSKNLQIRLLGHCIICLRKVNVKRKRIELGNGEHFRANDNCGSSTQPEIAPNSVVTTPGFLKTFNQVWTILYTKWKEKNTATSARKDGNGLSEEIGISLENVLQTATLSSNVSFSKAPTICQDCCDKVLAVENLMKAVRQQVREINMLLEEGRRRQDGKLGDFEKTLREKGLEEVVIRATSEFVGVFGSSTKEDFQDRKIDGQISNEGQTEDGNDDGDPDYIKSEEELDEDDEQSEEEMELDDEEDKNDPDCINEVGEDPLILFPEKREKDNSSPRKWVNQYTSSSEQMEANEDNHKFPCSCGKNFATRRKRGAHIRQDKKLHPEYQQYGNVTGHHLRNCALCGEKVMASDMLQHLTDEHLNGQAEWVLRCPNEKCRFICVSSKLLTFHMRDGKGCLKVWKEKIGNICETCGFKGTNRLNLKTHVRDKHENNKSKEDKKLRCPISGCGKMFCVRQSVHEHLDEHRYREPIRKQICDKCGMDLKVEEMDEHLKVEHGMEEVIGCGQCEMRFSGRDEMVEHLYEHRNVGICCDICGEDKFARYVDFREHYFGVHKLCPKRYKCGEGDCENWFWRKETRKDHELRLHKESSAREWYKKLLVGLRGKGKKEFECDVFIVKLGTEIALIKHKIGVHGEDPFRCDICGERFDEKKKLNMHKKEHAGIPVKKEWRCEVEGCGRILNEKRSLERHGESGHGGVKKHVCELCGKGYYDAKGLRGHRDTVHLGLRPWVCDECGERFASSTTLKRHKMIHTGERPFGCEVCGQRFRHKEVLKTHVKGHEKKGADFKPNGPMKQIRKMKAQ